MKSPGSISFLSHLPYTQSPLQTQQTNDTVLDMT
jgi:hypothetical protein